MTKDGPQYITHNKSYGMISIEFTIRDTGYVFHCDESQFLNNILKQINILQKKGISLWKSFNYFKQEAKSQETFNLNKRSEFSDPCPNCRSPGHISGIECPGCGIKENFSFKTWLEATRPYVKKLVDPALSTSEELYDILNKEGASHPSSAYRFSVDDKNNIETPKTNWPEFLQNKKINGINFEFRIKKTDKSDLQYAKTDENGKTVRDEKGEPLYFTKDEILKILKNRYDYSVGVFVGNTYVGGIDDEWGCVLYRVADEYQGFGLGTILAKIAWDLEPGKTSGGFTNAGYGAFFSWHREAVRDYLQSGMYSHLIRSGQISKERVDQIITSAKGASATQFPKAKKYDKNLNSDDPQDYLLLEHGGSFIIYNKKLKDLINDNEHYWKEKMVKGIIYAVEKRIKIFGGDTDEIKQSLLTLALIKSKEQALYVEPEDLIFVNKELMEINPESVKAGYHSHLIKMKKKIYMPIKSLILKERKFRQSFDKHDEFKIQLIELAYSKFEK